MSKAASARSWTVDAWDYTDELFLGPDGTDAGAGRAESPCRLRRALRYRRAQRQG